MRVKLVEVGLLVSHISIAVSDAPHSGLKGTTDTIFLEKPSYYDVLIDLTTSTPSRTSRPTLYLSKPQQQQPGTKGPTHRLSVFRFTWSDVKLVRIFAVTFSVYVLIHLTVE